MTEKPELSYIDERLCFALYSSSKAVIAEYQPYLSELGMTYPQYLVYMVLAENGEVTVSDLGEQLFLDSGTLTPVLKRMETAGLVTRKRSEEDERKVMVSLTKQASKLNDKIASMQNNVVCAIAENYPGLAPLRDELKALNARLRAR